MKTLAVEIRERLEAAVHLEGLPPEKEVVALWTVRLLVPKIVAIIRGAVREQRERIPL